MGQSTSYSSTTAIALCLSLLLFSIYLFSYSGLIHSDDEMSLLSVTESLVKYGGFDTNQIIWERWIAGPTYITGEISAGPFTMGTDSGAPNSQGAFGRDGNLYSKKGIGTSLLAAPLYWVALETPGIGLVQTTMLLNNMITACTGAILFLYVKRLGYSTSTSLTVTLLFSLGTMAWPYSKFLFSEPIVAFTLFLATYLLLLFREDPTSLPLLTGAAISLGMAFATKINNVVIVPFFFLYSMLPSSKLWSTHHLTSFKEQQRRERLTSALIFISLVLATLIPICLYNLFRYGNIFQSGYHPLETFSAPLGEGLYGLLLSPGGGLFIYAPILLLSIVSLPAFFKRHPIEAALGLWVFVSYCLLFAKWHAWSGGLGWGPRFLVPTIPFLMPWLAPAVELVLSKRSPLLMLGFILLSTFSVAVQLLGASVNPGPYLFFLPEPSWSAPRQWPIVALVLGGCPSCPRLDFLDFAWLRVSAGRISVDSLLIISPLVLVLLFSVGTYYFSRHKAGKKALSLLAIGGLTLSLGVAWLFLSRCHQDPRFGGGDDYHALLRYLQDASRPQDTLVLTNHTYTDFFLNYNKSRLNWYGFTWREQPLAAETIELLERLVSRYQRIWLVVDHVRALRLPSPVEEWLSQRAYKIDEKVFSDYARLCLYSTIDAPLESPQIVTASKLGDSIQLVGYDLSDLTSQSGIIYRHPGEALRLSLLWQTSASLQEDYTVFVQLLGPDGRLWCQKDSYPVDGLCPTSSWQVGEKVHDNYVVEISFDAPLGEYHLITGMYSLATMERLTVTTAQQANMGDHILLGRIVVVP